MFGKSRDVILRPEGGPARLDQFPFDKQQFPEKFRLCGRLDLGQCRFDARILSGPPGGLERVASGVDALARGVNGIVW